MSRQKKKSDPYTPEQCFRMKLCEERCKIPGMVVKIERMFRGSMRNYMVEYVPASSMDVQCIESQIRECFGGGDYFLSLVDEERRPLNEFGSCWLHLAHEENKFDVEKEEAEVDLMEALAGLCTMQDEIRLNDFVEITKACKALNRGY